MKTLRFLVVAFVVLLSAPLAAAEGGAPVVQVSGFVEALTALNFEIMNDDTNDNTPMSIAVPSARVRFNAPLTSWLTANMQVQGSAVGGGGAVSLAAATVAMSTTEGDTTYRFEIGRKAVPMGLAGGWNIAPANPFIHRPSLTTDHLGVWTDEGIYGSILGKSWSVQLYGVEGNNTSVVTNLNPAGNKGKGIAGGLRATASLGKALNVGVSYALNGWANGDAAGDNYSIMAGDAALKLGPCTLTYQYLASMPKFEFDGRKDSWFAQFEFDLKDIAGIPLEPGVRYDYLTSKFLGGSDAATILTVQAMYKFEKVLRIGLAYRNGKDASLNKISDLSLQVVTMF